jgi:NADPH:quinone reductase-like Zn-dependent oxidoreductase
MKAYVHTAYGPPTSLKLDEVPTPVPADDEVLIRVKAAATNPADWHIITGKPYIARAQYGLRTPKTPIRGLDLSGVIEEVGKDVTKFSVGDAVFGEIGGGYAEYTVSPERRLGLKPDNISFEEAAGVPIAALTALQALRDKGGIKTGDHVLVNGASGGVGTYAVQIAKAMGATVTGVCSTRNVDLVRSVGADEVIDYTTKSYLEVDDRFDIIVDCVGNHSPSKARGVLTERGVYVAVGNSKMGNGLGPLVWMARIAGASMFRSQTLTVMLAKQTPEDLAVLADLLASGEIRTVLDTGYSFDQAREALMKQGGKHGRGKTVITVEA